MENEIPETTTAVIYLRVSTKEQAQMGGEAEGYSIPAQREACLRKAASLKAEVVEEFVDRGESAKSADRPELQRLLAYVSDQPVSFVIVHKVDRLARNRFDDVTINLMLQKAGVKLVSVTENIDETPSGLLLHGIMSSIAEFYSRNLASEVTKGMVQKAKAGGTPSAAPIGYLNVRSFDSGREVRTVVIDPERAPLMKWVFEQYATGEWTIRDLLDKVTKRGLVSKATPKRPSQPLQLSHFHKLLRHPYYVGIVSYKGVLYQGKHEPLVSKEIWQEVQDHLSASNHVGEKRRIHNHYLKGSVFCGQCGSRLVVSYNTNRWGTVYYAGAIALDLLKQEQARIVRKLETAQSRVTAVSQRFEAVEANLKRALELAKDCQKAYREDSDVVRRRFNQAFFTKLLISEEYTVDGEMARPFDILLSDEVRVAAAQRAEIDLGHAVDQAFQARQDDPRGHENGLVVTETPGRSKTRPGRFLGQGVKETILVGPRGLEPLTS